MAVAEAELVSVQTLSPTVKGLVWRRVDAPSLPYAAGQWLNFDVPMDSGPLRRAYSIATAPDALQPQRFETAVTLVPGPISASQALHVLSPGAKVAIDGPHGFFTREQAKHLPAVFVATGTGLCPLRAMLEDELRDRSGPTLTLLFGCRSEADILWREQLESWASHHPRFSLYITLSRPSPAWTGLSGYVQRHLPQLIDTTVRPHVYVCGLTKMVSEVRKTLKADLGYDRRLIHSERYD